MYALLSFVWFTLERVRTVLLALAIIVLLKSIWIMAMRLWGVA
ncbi:MAG TPA: hypothetical protein VG943_00880 [Caulobacterales bacterium]|nr:hypothetical protein [Caulobacterales bacterium]